MKITKGQRIILIYIPLAIVGSFIISLIFSLLNLENISLSFIQLTTLGIISLPVSIVSYSVFILLREINKKLPESQKEIIKHFIESFKITNVNKSNSELPQQKKVVSKKLSKEKLILNIFTVLNILIFVPSLMLAGLSGLALGGSLPIPLLFKINNYAIFFFPLVIILSVIISRISFVSRVKRNSNNFKIPLSIIIAPVVIVFFFFLIGYSLMFFKST